MRCRQANATLSLFFAKVVLLLPSKPAAPNTNRGGGALAEMDAVYVTAVLIAMNISLELL